MASHARWEVSITKLTESMDKLADKVSSVHDNHGQLDTKVERYVSRLMGAIISATALVGVVTTLIAYIYLSDQKNTERHILSLMGEHKALQEQQLRSAAERELLFKALLKVIDRETRK